jgi:hypothetical protein
VLRKVEVEVPRLGRQVERLEWAAGFLVNDVQALHQPQEVADFGVCAGPPALVEVVAECGPAHRGEDEVPAAEPDVVVAVPGAQREFRGRERKFFPHDAAVHAHRPEVVEALGAGGLEQLAARGLEEAHPSSLEHGEGAFDDCVDLVVAQDLDGRVGIHEPGERQLPDRPGDASLAAAAADHDS